jgi:hypothetical protein
MFDPTPFGGTELYGVRVAGSCQDLTISDSKFNFRQGQVAAIGAAIKYEGTDETACTMIHHNTIKASNYSRSYFLDTRGGLEADYASVISVESNKMFSCEGPLRTTAMGIV